jgi:hypothetical protein
MNNKRRWSPERLEKFKATLAAKKKERSGVKRDAQAAMHTLADPEINVKECIQALEHGLHTLKRTLGLE